MGDPTAPRLRTRLRRLGVTLCVLAWSAAGSPAFAGEKEDARKARQARTQRLLKAAAKARHAVVRIHWKNDRDPDDIRVRNAVVVSSAGHLLLAGPRPAWNRGTLYAEFADGNTVKASYVTGDAGSGLSLLHVNYRDLTPLRILPMKLSDTPAAIEAPPPQPVKPPGGMKPSVPTTPVKPVTPPTPESTN